MSHRNKPSGMLPWARIMEIAFGVLQLPPSEFWRMTPCEWMAGLRGWKDAHGVAEESRAITRGELEELRQRFPDATA